MPLLAVNREVTAWLSAGRFLSVLGTLFAIALPSPSVAVEQEEARDRLRAALSPYDGPSAHASSQSGLAGRVMCGYQGWFTCPGDGADRGWHHWERRGKFEPGSCTIDRWPDVSELGPDERFATPFRLADGAVAEVYSSLHPKTVDRHFQWMAEHGIDGVFVQRFAVEVRGQAGRRHFNTVLNHCRAGANRHGRAWALMYDLSGLAEGETRSVIEDWKSLVDGMRLGKDPQDKAYLRYNGKPLVAVWGIGFDDHRRYTLQECAELIDFLQNDPEYGGAAVMIGVPSYWRTFGDDCVDDPRLHDIARRVDVVSPWAVGRFGDTEGVRRYAEEVWRPDIRWCRSRGVDYLPVVFPGFSWHNMQRTAPLDQIPRRGGAFLWEQLTALRDAGAEAAYVAMFDEMDEGTAVFKCASHPPVGASPFLDNEGLPSDHYLRLVGQGRRLIRGELTAAEIRGVEASFEPPPDDP